MKIKVEPASGIIAAVILISMIISMFAVLQSCDAVDSANENQNKDFIDEYETDGIKLDKNFVMQERTDKLVIYAMSMTIGTLTPAVNIFKEKYPDVNLEIITLSDEEFETTLQTELAAGKGPDLIFAFGLDFPNIYKTMATEIFVDLNQFIARDSEFNLDDYVKGVFDGGMYKGKRCIIPVEYAIPLLTTTQEILDEEGISSEDLKTFNGFLKSVGKYGEKYKDNPDKSAFSVGSSARYYIRDFLLYSGIDLINYETQTVTIDKAEFKNMMDTLKPMYVSEDNTESRIIMGKDMNLVNRSYLFNNFYTNTNYMLFGEQNWLYSESLTPLMFTFPNINNRAVAAIQTFTAIPKASNNQINAYNLMKIILSEEIQGGSGGGISYLMIGNPVLKKAVRLKIEQDSAAYDSIDEAAVSAYAELMMDIDSAKVMPHVVWKLVLEEMTPYFNDMRSFDDCYTRLVSTLELYISE